MGCAKEASALKGAVYHRFDAPSADNLILSSSRFSPQRPEATGERNGEMIFSDA
jgi:hypothetical protein